MYDFFPTLLFLIGVRSNGKSTITKWEVLLLAVPIVLIPLTQAWIVLLKGYSMLYYCSNIKCTKKCLCQLLIRAFVVADWIILKVKEKEIASLLQRFKTLKRLRGSIFRRCNLIINSATVIILLFSTVVYIFIVEHFLTNIEDSKRYFAAATFNANISLDDFTISILTALYFLVTRLTRTVIPSLLSIIYITWCNALCEAVKRCKDMIRIPTANKTLDYLPFIQEYTYTYNLIAEIENIFSSHVFCLIGANFFVFFLSFTQLVGFTSIFDMPQKTENFTILLVQGVLLFVIIYKAAKVGEEDRLVRKKVKDLVFFLLSSKETCHNGNFLSEFLNSKPNITLTAGGAFTFTKSLLFTTVGVIITYNLLILQLQIT
nr:uncharacterized protein LOC107436688 [Parasteatoda tepidariorum]